MGENVGVIVRTVVGNVVGRSFGVCDGKIVKIILGGRDGAKRGIKLGVAESSQLGDPYIVEGISVEIDSKGYEISAQEM